MKHGCLQSQRITDVETPAVITPLDPDVITPLPITPIASATRARTTSGKSIISSHAPVAEETPAEENVQEEITSRKSTAGSRDGTTEEQGPEIREWDAGKDEAAAGQKEVEREMVVWLSAE